MPRYTDPLTRLRREASGLREPPSLPPGADVVARGRDWALGAPWRDVERLAKLNDAHDQAKKLEPKSRETLLLRSLVAAEVARLAPEVPDTRVRKFVEGAYRVFKVARRPWVDEDYRGVRWVSSRRCFRAYVRRQHVGVFANARQAAIARDLFAVVTGLGRLRLNVPHLRAAYDEVAFRMRSTARGRTPTRAAIAREARALAGATV